MTTARPTRAAGADLLALPGVDAAALSSCLGAPVEQAAAVRTQGGRTVLFYAHAESFARRRALAGQTFGAALDEWTSVIREALELQRGRGPALLLADEAVVLRGAAASRRTLCLYAGLPDAPEPATSGRGTDAAIFRALVALAFTASPDLHALSDQLRAAGLSLPATPLDQAAELAAGEYRELVAGGAARAGAIAEAAPDHGDAGLADRMRLATDEIDVLRDHLELLQAAALSAGPMSHAEHRPPAWTDADMAAMQRLQNDHDQLRKNAAADKARLERERDALAGDLQARLCDREALRGARRTIDRLTEEIGVLMEQAVRRAPDAGPGR